MKFPLSCLRSRAHSLFLWKPDRLSWRISTLPKSKKEITRSPARCLLPPSSTVHRSSLNISRSSLRTTHGKDHKHGIYTWYRRGVDYSVFEIVFKYLTVEDSSSVFSRVCRSWGQLHSKMFQSYSSTLRSIDNSQISAREMQIIIERGGSHLVHIRMLGDIVRRDFRN